MEKFNNNYPIILLHGFFGWGENDGVMETGFLPYWGRGAKAVDNHIRHKYGTEVFCPSLGPFNGAWDRACIFWAYLFGGRVDFGKVHSEKYGHARFGGYFEHGVLEDLGKTEKHKKINIIGHSFGGNAAREIQNLFIQGSREEREGTPDDDLSDLFRGGHGHLIHSIMTLSGVNNGTTLASMLEGDALAAVSHTAIALATVFEKTPVIKMFDFGFQHWGLTTWPCDIEGWHFQSPFARRDVMMAYDKNKDIDAVAHEMQIEVVQEVINPSQVMSSDIYYFAQRAYKSHANGYGGHRPDFFTNPICAIPGLFTGSWQGNMRVKKFGVADNAGWKKNDGYVNYIGTSAPLDQPQEPGNWDTDFKPGIWYNMEAHWKDHLFWNSMSGSVKDLLVFFDQCVETMRSLPDGETVSS